MLQFVNLVNKVFYNLKRYFEQCCFNSLSTVNSIVDAEKANLV